MGRVGSVAVFGGGIAGIQAALDLAEIGFKVYLIDNKPSIGGVMAQLDKTFPTNDCAMCIMSPKLVDTGRHPNIEIITNADLKGLEGEAGNFKLTLQKRPRFVDESKCNGCGDCTEKCPVNIPSQFDEGMGERKAIYKLYPQAIPNIVSIDKHGISPCRDKCPASVNIQGYVALISMGEYKKAHDLIRERQPFPAVCGRICHHPCEAACNRKDVDEPVAINYLKRFAADYVMKNGLIDEEDTKDFLCTDSKVAIVGAGPAGLTCAKDLSERGYQVTVFEREDKPGGTLYTGIPDYRLNKEVLFAEANSILRNRNIEIEYGVTIGKDRELLEIKSQGYEAVFIATGATASRDLRVKGMDAEGVLKGIEFLRDVTTGKKIELHGVVIVIGGGNVAMDSARVALRLGAEKVIIVYRRTRKEMPAYRWEIEEALEEGVEIYNSWTPDKVISENGRIRGIKFIKCCGVFDIEGRFSTDVCRNESMVMDACYIITATGQVSDDTVIHDLDAIKTGEGNSIKVDPLTLQTDIEWIFAGGDVVHGPSSMAEAVAEGHEAAESIVRFIEGKDLKEGRQYLPGRIAEPPCGYFEKEARKRMPVRPVKERIQGFEEIELGYDEGTAVAEAQRCLDCSGCSECMICVETCGCDAIDHMMGKEEIVIDTGAIVLATGYDKFDPSGLGEYGYQKYQNVITSAEFERILSASGPSSGHLVRPSDHKEPEKIAWIQCVGSRQMREEGRAYCSSVCCMYSIKEAVITKEHNSSVDCHIYYIDIRAYGKDFDKYYERARDEYGVKFRQARLSMIEDVPGTDNLVVKYVDNNDEVREENYDMIVLSTGLVPNPCNENLSEITGITLNKFGFIDTGPFFSEKTNVDGIYVCGTASKPRDIPETITTASASVSQVSSLLKDERNTLTVKKEYPEERDISDEEPRLAVFICHCGINIGSVVDVPCVTEYAKTLPGVVYAEENLYTCSQDTQQKMKEVVQEYNINRVVIASCTPRTHEPLFQDTLKESGLNPFLIEFVSIREQCSWVHMREKERATQKAKELVAMGVARARLLVPFRRASFPVTKKGLVIGGGIAGMTAALSLMEQGFDSYLVERDEELGGNARDIHYDMDGNDVQQLLADLIQRVTKDEAITVFTDSEVTEVAGYVGNYDSTVRNNNSGEETQITYGAVIVATGAVEVKTDEYLYGESDLIVTQRELEEKIVGGEAFGSIAMIQCVGARDEKRPYCSRVCCQSALKNAIRIKERTPESIIHIFYRDIRSYGLYEEYYQKAREMGVNFIRYDLNNKPEVSLSSDKKLVIRYHDMLLRKKLELPSDLLTLSTGMEPPESKSISNMFKVPLNKDGFFLEAHAKLRPLDFSAEGLYLCGLAHSPKNITESISQAGGAAARAATLLAKDTVQSSGKIVQVKDRICSGCGMCVDICPFDAREIDEETAKAKTVEVLCQGCGLCSTACPNAATQQTTFTKRQIYQMIEEAV
ncbi:MAG: FAD-dependent oxidoreductase [Spirochaetota bacterium]|nr:MAG: FAD-dependent oxidoreductase [Spirochaetota bacterium]